jgi:hypothetical protein
MDFVVNKKKKKENLSNVYFTITTIEEVSLLSFFFLSTWRIASFINFYSFYFYCWSKSFLSFISIPFIFVTVPKVLFLYGRQ